MVCRELRARSEEKVVALQTSSSLNNATEYREAASAKKPSPQDTKSMEKLMQVVLVVDSNAVEDGENDDEGDYGWFSGSDTEELSESEVDQAPALSSVESVQQKHRTSMQAKETCHSATAHIGVEFRAHNKRFALATRTFYVEDSRVSATAWTWGIGGFRIIKSKHGRHAEFQVVASYGGGNGVTWAVWKRFSDFTAFSQSLQDGEGRTGNTEEAWGRVRRGMKLFRCLDPGYLKIKCVLLEDFIRNVLFDIQDPSILIKFMTQERRPKS
ncbi:unnamed protein product [Discosporangium mesarthrocarpum]